ncbi:MAG: 50S ribosomal protein L35 [Syntrophorhabdaceae bacterium]|nr:50S ribosomal protein L35 [Syntrophorhabdaceae bacterium]
MPKMKTCRGAAKRFKATGGGSIKCAKSGKRHILSNKNRKRKRRLRKSMLVNPAMEHLIRRLTPYI